VSLKRAIDPVTLLDWILRVSGTYEIVKKLYNHLDADRRWTIRILVAGSIAILPSLSTVIVLMFLGILPIGLNGDALTMLGGASALPVVFLVTFPFLWRWLGRYIDLKPPRDQHESQTS